MRCGRPRDVKPVPEVPEQRARAAPDGIRDVAGSSEGHVEPDQRTSNDDHRGTGNGESSSGHRYPAETKGEDRQGGAIDQYATAVRAGLAPADHHERRDP